MVVRLRGRQEAPRGRDVGPRLKLHYRSSPRIAASGDTSLPASPASSTKQCAEGFARRLGMSQEESHVSLSSIGAACCARCTSWPRPWTRAARTAPAGEASPGYPLLHSTVLIGQTCQAPFRSCVDGGERSRCTNTTATFTGRGGTSPPLPRPPSILHW